MKKIKFLIVTIFSAMISLSSCSSSTKGSSDTETTDNKSSILQIDDVMQNGERLIGQEIEIEGVCTHICKHGGRKIFLMGSSDKYTLRIESGELGKFDQKCVNSIVKVKGVLVEEKIDEAYLTKWEETLKQQNIQNHGDSEAGCTSEKKARGETANYPQTRIENFSPRIA